MFYNYIRYTLNKQNNYAYTESEGHSYRFSN